MTSPIPSVHVLGVKRWSAGTPDAMGNVVPSYAAPVDWLVRSVDPVSAREQTGGRDLTQLSFVIQADKTGQIPTYQDRVVIDGVEYDVDGTPDDWSRGPWFNPVAGVTVYVKRVEG